MIFLQILQLHIRNRSFSEKIFSEHIFISFYQRK